jgi:hypothetical protein
VLGKNLRIGEELFHALDAIENFDEPCVMVVETAEHRRTLELVEFGELLVARGVPQRSATFTRQRADR